MDQIRIVVEETGRDKSVPAIAVLIIEVHAVALEQRFEVNVTRAVFGKDLIFGFLRISSSWLY